MGDTVWPTVYPCTCEDEYQDKHYGKGKRVMNRTTENVVDNYYFRCTVCEKEHLVTNPKVPVYKP